MHGLGLRSNLHKPINICKFVTTKKQKMQIAEIKLEIFRYIDNLDNSKLTHIYNSLFHGKEKQEIDFWDTLSEIQKKDIELGIADLEAGKKGNFDEFIQKF